LRVAVSILGCLCVTSDKGVRHAAEVADIGGAIAMTAAVSRPPAWSPVRKVVLCDERASTSGSFLGQLHLMPPGIDITCVADGFALVDAYTRSPPDLVLIGMQRGRRGDMQALDFLLGLHPTAVVIGYGTSQDIDHMVEAVTRGARGLMVWDPDQRIQRSPTAPALAVRSTVHSAAGDSETLVRPLTDRELQVLHGMSAGHSNGEIGRELFLSEDTVKTHARRLFGKLGARDRAHAVAVGLRRSLIS